VGRRRETGRKLSCTAQLQRQTDGPDTGGVGFGDVSRAQYVGAAVSVTDEMNCYCTCRN
jgi:hypothetical protein